MKICFLTTSYPLFRGHFQGNFIRTAAIELIKQGHLVTVVAPGAYNFPKREVDNGIVINRFSYFPISKLQKLAYGPGILPNMRSSMIARCQIPFFLLAFLVTALRESRGHDIIHAHWSASAFPGFWCSRCYQIPVILSVRGSDFSGAGGIYVDKVTEYILKRVDGVITENDQLKEKALKLGLNKDRIETIRNGVDLDSFKKTKDRSVLTKISVKTTDIIILFVGRLSYVKGPDIALKAFEQTAIRYENIFLVFVGDGEMKRDLEIQSDQSPHLRNRVFFLGEVPRNEIPSYYGAADIAVISSRSEGTPNILLECLASGTPIVTLPVGGVPEIIQNGKTGVIAENSSIDALKGALTQLIKDKDLRAKLSKNGKEWVKNNSSWKGTVDKYLLFYNKILKEKYIC